jgi:hypothetical protein
VNIYRWADIYISFRWLGPLQIFHIRAFPPFYFPDCKDSFEKLAHNLKKQDGRKTFLDLPNSPLPVKVQSFVDLFG